MATKAAIAFVTQIFRSIYLGVVLAAVSGTNISVTLIVAALLISVGFTSVAALIIKRMSNKRFKAWNGAVIALVGGVLVGYGVWLLLV